MKHKVRDSIIFFIHVLGISTLYRMYVRRKGPLVRILCFHDVADRKWFDEVVAMLVSNYHVISPEQFHAKQFHEKKINILLTFDDGYLSWIDNCLPVLQNNKIKGLFFVNSGLLDIAEDTEKVEEYMKERLLISPKAPLTWQGAEQLISEGHTIGGHTVTHPNLASLPTDEQKKEIEEDKKKIESMLGIELEDFAFPFGHMIKLDTNKYNYMYSTEAAYVSEEKNIIPRMCIEKNQSCKRIRIWIAGSYDMFSKYK